MRRRVEGRTAESSAQQAVEHFPQFVDGLGHVQAVQLDLQHRLLPEHLVPEVCHHKGASEACPPKLRHACDMTYCIVCRPASRHIEGKGTLFGTDIADLRLLAGCPATALPKTLQQARGLSGQLQANLLRCPPEAETEV